MFHIHVGYENPDIDTSIALVKYLDAYLGVPSVLKDKDKKRRSLYGKAGCFRLCDYGMEYRVLSSVMMSSTTKLNFVWSQLEKALIAFQKETPLPDMQLVTEAINNSNSELAETLVSNYNLVLGLIFYNHGNINNLKDNRR